MARYEILTSEDGNRWELYKKLTDGEQAKNHTFGMIERGETYVKMMEIDGASETEVLYGEKKSAGGGDSGGGHWLKEANKGSDESGGAKKRTASENNASLSEMMMLLGVGVVLVLGTIIIGKFIFHIEDVAVLFFISAGILAFAGVFYYIISVIPSKISAMTFAHRPKEEDEIREDDLLGPTVRDDQLEIGDAEEDTIPEEAFAIKKRIRQFVKNAQAVAKAADKKVDTETLSRMSLYSFLSQVIRACAFEEKLDFHKQVLTMKEIYSILKYPDPEIEFFARNVLLFEAIPLVRSMSNAGMIAFELFSTEKKGEAIRHIKQSMDDWSANALQNPFAVEVQVISFQGDTQQNNLIRTICNGLVDFNVMKEVKWTSNSSVYVIKTGTPYSSIFQTIVDFTSRTQAEGLMPRVSIFSGAVLDTSGELKHTISDYVNFICNDSHNGLLVVPKFKAVDFPKEIYEQMREVPTSVHPDLADKDITNVAISLQMVEQYVKSQAQAQTQADED